MGTAATSVFLPGRLLPPPPPASSRGRTSRHAISARTCLIIWNAWARVVVSDRSHSQVSSRSGLPKVFRNETSPAAPGSCAARKEPGAQAYYRVPRLSRLAVGAVYVGLAAALILGMDATHLQRSL